MNEVLNIKKLITKVYMKNNKLSKKESLANLHLFRGTHRVAYTKEGYYGSYGCPPPNLFFDFLVKRNGNRVYSEKKIQDFDKYCTAYR